MKILVAGGGGQLAYDIHRCAIDDSVEVILCDRHELDITDRVSIDNAFAIYQPDIVVNTAAYTAVDKAEEAIEEASKINEEGARAIAIACEKKQIPLIQLSTDYVFDGRYPHAYREEDPVFPLNHYGKSKWQGEQAVRECCERHIIVRLSGIFGVHGHNFVKTILKLAAEREHLRIVSDQMTCPTPARDIAEALLKIIPTLFGKNPPWGTYHYCSSEPVSWFQFAEIIVEEAKRYQPLAIKKIEAITTADYRALAARPLYSVLDCTKISKLLGIYPISWRSGLMQVIKELLE